MKQLTGKRAVITGAASGIGRAIARRLASEGVHVCLIDIDAGELAAAGDAVRALGVDVLSYAIDAAERDQVQSALAQLSDAWPGVEILVNSTGSLYWGPSDAMTAADCEAVLVANLEPFVRVTHCLLPLLLAADEAHIVNVTSLAGLFPAQNRAVYTACKAAIVGFSESLEVEYGRSGLHVSAICPAVVRGTRLFERMLVADGVSRTHAPGEHKGALPVEAVAEAVVRAIREQRRIVIVPEWLRAFWWLQRWLPAGFERLRQHVEPAVRSPRAAKP